LSVSKREIAASRFEVIEPIAALVSEENTPTAAPDLTNPPLTPWLKLVPHFCPDCLASTPAKAPLIELASPGNFGMTLI